MRVLFFDPCCPTPYTALTLETQPLGGTEATVIRIVEGLRSRGHQVVVMQHNSKTLEGSYVGMDADVGSFDVVVALRDLKTLPYLKDRFPRSKLFLWCHDLPNQELCQNVELLDTMRADLICVSKWHQTQVIDKLLAGGYDGQDFRVRHIYNPIDTNLVPDSTPIDPHKLVFFSSPHKGLDDVLLYFKAIRRFDPAFNLYVANPGYYPTPELRDGGVITLGPLPHSEIIKHVRSSLGVLYTNSVFPETFGLVMAEANAVGTPVLTHGIGAASEILDSPQYEIVDTTPKAVVDTILKWYNGERPTVRGRKEFRLANVLNSWEGLL